MSEAEDEAAAKAARAECKAKREAQRPQAIAWYSEGRIIADIARDLGQSTGTVWNWLNREGLIRPSAKTLHRDQALVDYQKGDSYEVVAERYGVSEATVRNWVRDAGLKGQGGRKAVYVQKRREAVGLYAQGKRNSEIAEALGLHQSVVSRWLLEEGVNKDEGGAALAAKIDAREAIRLYGNGATIEIIAKHLRRGENTVAGWLGEAGVHIQSAIERRTPEQQRAYALLGAAATKAKAAAEERICKHCKQPYTVKSALKKSSPQKYCTRKCAADARRDPDKKLTTTCETCEEPFETYLHRPAKFCSRNCADQGRRAIQWEFDGNVLDSSWEALFVGLAAMNGLPCTRFDRTGVVTWNGDGNVYGPDFTIAPRGQQIAVEIKGAQEDSDRLKWAAYRRTGALLVVLNRALLNELKPLSAAAFADRLLALALTQGEQDS